MGSMTEIIRLIEKLPEAEKENALKYLKEISKKYENSNASEDADLTTSKKLTCADLLSSDLVGIWKDRKDITDSVKFINDIRNKMSRRV